ncbi:hypothetical protein M885DRAFT_617991 [Pelagophyceae sp. CCMP2097]|nr:hypothetical protein M885DRAFT_617991 [Pelagophyceae sp. CCMP2097]
MRATCDETDEGVGGAAGDKGAGARDHSEAPRPTLIGEPLDGAAPDDADATSGEAGKMRGADVGESAPGDAAAAAALEGLLCPGQAAGADVGKSAPGDAADAADAVVPDGRLWPGQVAGHVFPALRALTSFGFGVASLSTRAGFGAGRLTVRALGAALDERLPTAARGLELLDGVALAAAQRASLRGIATGRDLADFAVDGVAAAVGPGAPRLPATDALRAVVVAARSLADDDDDVPRCESYASMFHAARALSAAQAAAREPAVTNGRVLGADEDALARVYVTFAAAAYGARMLKAMGVLPLLSATNDDVDAISALTGVAPGDVLRVEPHGVFAPAFFVAYHAQDTVVISFRGTASAAEALTDLVCQGAPFLGGEAHHGMLRAATEFCQRERDFVERISRGKASIVVTGHSLGAGVATLVAALWRDEAFWKERGGRCVVYGPPCTLSERAAPVAALAVAFDDDVVCSTSLGSVLELRDRLRALAGDAPLCERLLAADVAPALARKALQDLRLVVPPRDKLRPAGSLFLVEPRRGAAFGPTPLVGVDATEFSELHLRSPGNHSPIFYLRALIDFQPYACLHKGAATRDYA